ncbi:hypothetical protein IPG41_04095 [Candidatus Peregrinibacteria bacterium]|nr:MAG: hypothetical protein IPG41_04095 [Candidatus Peregrinibacteria bacterium]
MANKEIPENGKDVMPIPAGSPAIDIQLLSLEVTREAYDQLMARVDAKYTGENISAGNLFKKYVSKQMTKAGQESIHKSMQEIEKTFVEFNKMFDALVLNKNNPAFAQKLGIKMSVHSPDKMAEMARASGVTNPEQMAIIKFYAVIRGVDTLLEREYEDYISKLFLPDITSKFNALNFNALV